MARRPGAMIPAGLLLGALPLLVTRPAPLQDWPNHVARMHVLVGLLGGDPFWTHYYRFVGFLVPDAAFDLVVLGLHHAGLPAEVAAQWFLIGTYLVFVGGFCALARAFGTPEAHGSSGTDAAPASIRLAFAILLFYGNALFWGLANYVLGIGLMLCLLALWLAPARDGPRRRLLIAGAGAGVLVFTHVVAAVAWIVILGCFDLCRLLSSRAPLRTRLPGSASWLAAAAVVGILLHALPGEARHEFSIRYAGIGVGGFVSRKLWLFGKLLLGGSLLQDAASIAALLCCAAVVASARPRLSRAPALTVAALVVLTFAAPERVGTGSVLDVRLAILPLLLLAAAVRIEPGRLGVPLVTAAVLARTLVLAVQWHAAGAISSDFRRQAVRLPAGSVMMVAYGTRLSSLTWQQVWSPPLSSLATQAVSGGIFMPALFANPAEQPIELRPAYRSLTQPWNMTDGAHLHATAVSLATLCGRRDFRGVYLTVLYPGGFLPSQVDTATLHAQRDFLILDACRLPR